MISFCRIASFSFFFFVLSVLHYCYLFCADGVCLLCASFTSCQAIIRTCVQIDIQFSFFCCSFIVLCVSRRFVGGFVFNLALKTCSFAVESLLLSECPKRISILGSRWQIAFYRSSLFLKLQSVWTKTKKKKTIATQFSIMKILPTDGLKHMRRARARAHTTPASSNWKLEREKGALAWPS